MRKGIQNRKYIVYAFVFAFLLMLAAPRVKAADANRTERSERSYESGGVDYGARIKVITVLIIVGVSGIVNFKRSKAIKKEVDRELEKNGIDTFRKKADYISSYFGVMGTLDLYTNGFIRVDYFMYLAAIGAISTRLDSEGRVFLGVSKDRPSTKLTDTDKWVLGSFERLGDGVEISGDQLLKEQSFEVLELGSRNMRTHLYTDRKKILDEYDMQDWFRRDMNYLAKVIDKYELPPITISELMTPDISFCEMLSYRMNHLHMKEDGLQTKPQAGPFTSVNEFWEALYENQIQQMKKKEVWKNYTETATFNEATRIPLPEGVKRLSAIDRD